MQNKHFNPFATDDTKSKSGVQMNIVTRKKTFNYGFLHVFLHFPLLDLKHKIHNDTFKVNL